MDNYLKRLCINLGIELIYTNNKITVLSADVKNGIPIIRAHKMFKNCSHKLAQAVVGYYTEIERRIVHEEVIKEYIKIYCKGNEIKIKPFNLKKYTISNMPGDEITNANGLTLEEYGIFSMTVKNFLGEEKKQEVNGGIRTADDKLLELDIIVKPPVT